MKKVTFYKTMFGGKGKPPRFETASGYQSFYTVTGTDIELSLIFHKSGASWAITEESTGLLIQLGFGTRKEAESAITPDLLRKINDRLPSVNEYRTMLNIYRGRVGEQSDVSKSA